MHYAYDKNVVGWKLSLARPYKPLSFHTKCECEKFSLVSGTMSKSRAPCSAELIARSEQTSITTNTCRSLLKEWRNIHDWNTSVWNIRNWNIYDSKFFFENKCRYIRFTGATIKVFICNLKKSLIKNFSMTPFHIILIHPPI